MSRTLDSFFTEDDFRSFGDAVGDDGGFTQFDYFKCEQVAEKANAILAEWVKANGVKVECHNEMTKRIWWKEGETPFGHPPHYSGILLDVKPLGDT